MWDDWSLTFATRPSIDFDFSLTRGAARVCSPAGNSPLDWMSIFSTYTDCWPGTRGNVPTTCQTRTGHERWRSLRLDASTTYSVHTYARPHAASKPARTSTLTFVQPHLPHRPSVLTDCTVIPTPSNAGPVAVARLPGLRAQTLRPTMHTAGGSEMKKGPPCACFGLDRRVPSACFRRLLRAACRSLCIRSVRVRPVFDNGGSRCREARDGVGGNGLSLILAPKIPY